MCAGSSTADVARALPCRHFMILSHHKNASPFELQYIHYTNPKRSNYNSNYMKAVQTGLSWTYFIIYFLLIYLYIHWNNKRIYISSVLPLWWLLLLLIWVLLLPLCMQIETGGSLAFTRAEPTPAGAALGMLESLHANSVAARHRETARETAHSTDLCCDAARVKYTPSRMHSTQRRNQLWDVCYGTNV